VTEQTALTTFPPPPAPTSCKLQCPLRPTSPPQPPPPRRSAAAARRPCPAAQAFASPAKLAELVGRVNGAMRQLLPAVVAKTQLYLPNPNTRAILFRPVKSNIAEVR